MSIADSYRKDIPTIISYFRPVLSQLNIRNREKQEQVFLSQFEYLDFLKLENLVAVVIPADIKSSKGMFFCRHIDNKLTVCYILIDNSLYDEKNLEKVKIIGVHEFCHFMAIIYTLTATTIERQKKNLIDRISKKIDVLNNESLNRLYEELNKNIYTDSVKSDDSIKSFEFDDSHFRLQCEGETADYALLFRHFMFSRELFEEYFTEKDQKEFSKITQNKVEYEQIKNKFIETKIKSENEKYIQFMLELQKFYSLMSD